MQQENEDQDKILKAAQDLDDTINKMNNSLLKMLEDLEKEEF